MDILDAVLEEIIVQVEKSKSIIQSLVGFHWAIV
jgi:hypothetical protein